MSLNKVEIEKVISELQKLIIPCQITNIMESEYNIIFYLSHHTQTDHLLLSLKPGFTRVHLSSKKWKSNATPSHFLSYMKKFLQNGIINNISIINSDRVIEIEIEKGNQVYYLLIEMIQKRENIIVLDERKFVLYQLNAHQNNYQTGDEYQAPEPKEYQVKSFVEESNEMLYNQTIEEHYQQLLEQNKFQNNYKKVKASLERSLKNSTKVIANLEKQIENCNTWEDWMEKGELLKSHIHLLKRGLKEIKIQNYFDPNLSEITISLNSEKSPSDNVESYYKKSKKLKNGLKYVEQKFEESKSQYERVFELNNYFQSVGDTNSLRSYLDQHRDEPEIRQAFKEKSEKQNLIKRASTKPYKEFLSAGNKTILVGKSNKDNDKLTISIAKGNDLWLHIRDYPGSHVVVPLKKNEDVDQETLFDSAQLALNYSKAKNHKEGEVMYTKRKFISKRKKSPPGQVQVSQFKSIFIKLDTERLLRIKERTTLD